MMIPRFFGESLLDDWMRDPWNTGARTAPEKTGTRKITVMRTDIREKDGNYVLDMELPGYKKENISVKLENGTLTVQAAGNEAGREGEDDGFLRREHYAGSCARSFYIGEALRQEEIQARFENGILTLVFPKEPAPQPEESKYISIEG